VLRGIVLEAKVAMVSRPASPTWTCACPGEGESARWCLPRRKQQTVAGHTAAGDVGNNYLSSQRQAASGAAARYFSRVQHLL
jgi:hypothetical protein